MFFTNYLAFQSSQRELSSCTLEIPISERDASAGNRKELSECRKPISFWGVCVYYLRRRCRRLPTSPRSKIEWVHWWFPIVSDDKGTNRATALLGVARGQVERSTKNNSLFETMRMYFLMFTIDCIGRAVVCWLLFSMKHCSRSISLFVKLPFKSANELYSPNNIYWLLCFHAGYKEGQFSIYDLLEIERTIL